MDLVAIGERIKAARRERRWSQTRLAEKAGVSRARLEALENARVADVGLKTLSRILHALDLDLRLSELNRGRPTLEDLVAEEAAQHVARLD